MSKIEFSIRVEELGGGGAQTVVPVIDGISLIELARRVEAGPAAASGEADLAGRYAGLVIGEREWQQWYTGENPQIWFDDADSCLLGCTCGETGCWPLTARIAYGRHEVRWSSFRTGHRPWNLTGLGPFRFDRNAYDRALRHPTSR